MLALNQINGQRIGLEGDVGMLAGKSGQSTLNLFPSRIFGVEDSLG